MLYCMSYVQFNFVLNFFIYLFISNPFIYFTQTSKNSQLKTMTDESVRFWDAVLLSLKQQGAYL